MSTPNMPIPTTTPIPNEACAQTHPPTVSAHPAPPNGEQVAQVAQVPQQQSPHTANTSRPRDPAVIPAPNSNHRHQMIQVPLQTYLDLRADIAKLHKELDEHEARMSALMARIEELKRKQEVKGREGWTEVLDELSAVEDRLGVKRVGGR